MKENLKAQYPLWKSPFLETFKEAGYDFYKVDPGLFVPAIFVVNNSKTGKTFRAGKIDVKSSRSQ